MKEKEKRERMTLEQAYKEHKQKGNIFIGHNGLFTKIDKKEVEKALDLIKIYEDHFNIKTKIDIQEANNNYDGNFNKKWIRKYDGNQCIALIVEEDKPIEKILVNYQDGHSQEEINEYLRCEINELIEEINKLKKESDK